MICRKNSRHLFHVFLFFLGFPFTASAQGDGMIIIAGILNGIHQVADLSFGFSMAHSRNPIGESVIPLGIQFGCAGRINRSLGIDIDLAVQSSGKIHGTNEKFNMFQYLFGPHYRIVNARRITIFNHLLVGGLHYWQDSGAYVPSTYEHTGFAMALGGGIDIGVNQKIALRVAQIDWIPFREKGSWNTSTTRFGFGIVLKSGKDAS